MSAHRTDSLHGTPPLGRTVRRVKQRVRSWYERGLLGARRMGWRAGVLPDFVIIGAQKAGTTSLFHYLSRHPQISPPLKKEIHYFDDNARRGPDWYRAHFPTAPALRRRAAGGQRMLTGEATPYYLVHPTVPERLHALVPDALLIVLLRNPADRAFSNYKHEVWHGRETRPFERALEEEDMVLAGEEERLAADPDYFSAAHRYCAYRTRGEYVNQLRRWLCRWRREQLLVVKSEEFFADTETAFRGVTDFLRIDPWRPARFAARHVKPMPQTVFAPDTRQRLLEHYEPFNAELSQLLDDDYRWMDD